MTLSHHDTFSYSQINGYSQNFAIESSHFLGLLHSYIGKESSCNAGDQGSLPG